jgi:hypothetical protein
MSVVNIHNLYWDTSWDAHNPGAPTVEQLDDFTSKVTSSGYMAKLGQYGFTSASFTGSDMASSSCPMPPSGSNIDYFALSGWILCMKHSTPASSTDLWMVYVPPTVGFNELGFSSCRSGSGSQSFAAFHALTLPSIIPLDSAQIFGVVMTQCTGGLDRTTTSASHEIVEATTDPVPGTEWIDHSVAGFLGLNLIALYTAGEASDLCDGVPGSPVSPPPLGPARIGGGVYAVDFYWSNSDGACVPLPDTLTVNATGLPATATGSALIDGVLTTLPSVQGVADGTSHQITFVSPISDSVDPLGTRYVTSPTSRSVVVTGPTTVTANYTTQFNLSVNTSPGFLPDTTLTPSGFRDAGTVVNLTTDPLIPSPSQGRRYRFESWSGDLTVASPPSVTMDRPRSVTANYVQQELVDFEQNGIPGGVPWHVTVAGTIHPGPDSEWMDSGPSQPFSYESPVPDPAGGTQYVLSSTSLPSGFSVIGPTTVFGNYGTQRLLTVTSSGLGANVAHIFNHGSLLGTVTDAAPLSIFLPDGTLLNLTADTAVSQANGVQLLFTGFTPPPPATLTGPFSTVAVYQTMSGVIAGGVASGGLSGPGSHGIANALQTKWNHAESDLAGGDYSGALQQLRAFINQVDAQSGKKLTADFAITLELDALAVYHNALCLALAAGQITPSQAASDYSYYSSLVTADGGTPLPTC